jgi:mannose-6-phosphate isomerase-like protein (cupin superfamily)
MKEPIISTESPSGLAGAGFEIREWSHGLMGGPPLHVHHSDDEAWHVLEGSLRFRFTDRNVEADAGTTVLVPAGVAHTYGNPGPADVRYLIITTPRVFALIEALHAEGLDNDSLVEIYGKYDSEILE